MTLESHEIVELSALSNALAAAKGTSAEDAVADKLKELLDREG